MMLIQIFPRRTWKGKRWFFRIVSAKNWETVAQSEAYHNHADALATVSLLRRELAGASLEDLM